MAEEEPQQSEGDGDHPQAVHRTGGPPVDPDVAKAEEPGGTGGIGDGNGDGQEVAPTSVPLDAQGQAAAEPDRLAMAVAAEQPPRLPFVVIGVGASAGGLEAFTEFLSTTPADPGMAFVFIIHLPPDRESQMVDVLSRRTPLRVVQVEDGMPVEADHVYVIRPGRTLLMQDGLLRLTEPLEKRGHGHPVDDFFRSLAAEQRERAVCVILSGMGSNGSVGAQAVKAVGGVCVAQDPDSALYPSMPRHLIDQGNADYVLRPRDIPAALQRFADHPYVRGGEAAAAVTGTREQQHYADVLAVLRTRTRQDFSGYKRPTILRRIQRRMGLNQYAKFGDYVALLRNNAAEVQALADDLLIHVTGFFRDPGAWETLRERVVEPLVAGREVEQSVRCWVTACSTGEEAYTLAILLAEAMEKYDKPLDVKIFATDMADRALLHARAGSFPLGIEAEVSPERLARFFEREDATYRVRKELREMVVFAPQNVLHDPPFSRLDVCTCRNLLIYLEPDVQRRVLSLIHFGLRDGGALMLGPSETVGGVEEMFEPLDKKWRLFRRVGPTRHGQVDFPLPRAVGVPRPADRAAALVGGVGGGGDPRAQRASVGHLAERTLLQRFTPAAVVIDREFRVVYYHGATERFLIQPGGEPTRELLLLARDTVRGAVRVALTAAVEGAGYGEARDGTIRTDEGTRRVWVTVAPLDGRAAGPHRGYFLVTFEDRPEPPPSAAALPPEAAGDGDSAARLTDELARVRDELQTTIEELQSSNEELKASNEEITSINEELQSSNEELETSKEELQSLNEELTTVNAQVLAKNEELQATGSDLQSLLSSTDIAVIFLDPRMRIRRFTPAVRELVDLISSDVGRPLADLNRKFEDPALLDDAQAVLDRLVPAQAEVRATDPRRGERWFQRRITPYRTSDDRIDGVVVTFFDVTERLDTQRALAASREYAESIVETLHEPLLVLHPDLTVKSANAAFYRDFKVRPDQTLGRKIYDLGNGQWNIPALRRAMEDVLPQNSVFNDYEVSHVFEDLGLRVMLLNGRRLDHLQLILLGIRDVTDRHDAEAALRGSEVWFRTLVQSLHDYAMLMTDPDGVVTEWSEGAQRITGFTAAEAIGKHVSLLYTPEQVADGYVGREFGQAAQAGRAEREDWRVRKGGERIWCNEVVTAVRDAAGRLSGFAKISRDLTDRKRAEAALREGDERFRLVFEGARDFAMIMQDPSGKVTAWNTGAERLTGFAKDEAVGQNGALIFTPEDRTAGAADQERRQAAANGSAVDERWHVHKDGSRFWGSGAMTALRNPDGSLRGFVKLLRDETARKAAEDALSAAKAAAELANRMKDEFLATLSHELRTPMSSILIWSKLLRRQLGEQPDHPEYAEAIDAIIRSADAQRQLIEDLLDTSRITSGKLRLEMRLCDLTPLAQQSVESVRPTAEAKGVDVRLELGNDVGVVWADPDRVRQVVWNLLANAVKFTPAGGRVDVGLWRRGGRSVEIRVADTGAGIDPSFLPHVFEPFRQADASSTRTQGGLGLGLAICKQLVEQHGGTIAATSDGPGKGSTFTVRLPLPAVRGAGATARQPAPALPDAPGASLAGVRVLLVEDDAETRNALAKVLRGAAADVTAVDSTAAALAAFERARPDLIVSDIGMPGEDGYALIRQVRALEARRKGKPVPAVALTAFAREDDRHTALSAGFDRHVGKPADPEQLLSVLWELTTGR